MMLDKELKESLNLSFKYLRAYGESEILSAADGWQGVYGDVSQEQEEDTAVEEEVLDDTPPPPSPQIQTIKETPKSHDLEKPSRGLGMGSKIILSIVAIWGLVAFVVMVKLFF